jgi:hypothetical protein
VQKLLHHSVDLITYLRNSTEVAWIGQHLVILLLLLPGELHLSAACSVGNLHLTHFASLVLPITTTLLQFLQMKDFRPLKSGLGLGKSYSA